VIEALKDLSTEDYARLVPNVPQIVAYRGSHTHGTYIPPIDDTGHDDIDLMTVYIDPRISTYFGTDGQTWSGREAKIGPWDGVSYQLQHFAKLAAAANPNVLSMLWLRPEHYLLLGSAGKILIEHRDMFSSRLAAKSFAGYAMGQLKRMTAWKDEQAAGCGCDGAWHAPECPLRAERGRGSAKLYATGFMGAKRKALVKKHGYDTKNAAHLIRLLRMGREFLATGRLNVWREDADVLISIKRGEWSLQEVLDAANAEEARLNEFRFMSPLPEKPDFEAINQLVTLLMCRELVSSAYREAFPQ
jgi:hypothetical protein